MEENRIGTVRERWGQGTLKTQNRGKRLVIIVPQRMSPVIGGWLDIVAGKVKESLCVPVKKELSERIQIIPLTVYGTYKQTFTQT